jgi:hypothetical protein
MENMANWGYLRYTKSSPNTPKVFERIRRIRRKNHGEDAKRFLAFSPNTPRPGHKSANISVNNGHKSANISVNNNTNLKIFLIHTNYTIWDGLSQKTISRYCPFQLDMRAFTC